MGIIYTAVNIFQNVGSNSQSVETLQISIFSEDVLLSFITICGISIQVKIYIYKGNSLFNKLNSDNLAPDPRFGHTAIFYNKKIYFLGGKIKLNNNFSYLAEIDIFNLGKFVLIKRTSTGQLH